ncbi:uncharacterized protein LOC119667882 [Teleopsis dalmanni]|uniref:uncharacterized protein LOC119667882 n=1 Tax=Teleopsis dalmanni TaxID=139649 RepID=UPI0018CEEED7|nr:uncharacterized protein LOC119667882 [Teleopsis dalmanni]
MPSRRSGGVGTTRRKHSLGNLRRAHPASGATWNVQVVRGKMSSKCLWHACRALILGLTLMLLGAGMATLGYYADHLSMGSEIRGNATIRVKNDLKGFHLNNFSYVGPIVMGFGGFIVVASCVMTFEARDSAAKVVPARFRAGGSSKTTVRSNQSSSASTRRAMGLQMQSSRWDHHFGVFRSSPADPKPSQTTPFDRDALTAELIKFSKSLSASARFSPQLRRLTYTGSVPNLSTHTSHPLVYSTNISHLLSPNHKSMLLEHKRHRHHRHHHRHHHIHTNSSGRHIKNRGTRISNSLVQRTTRENAVCALLQPPANRLYWHASSFDESGRTEKQLVRNTERNRRSDTAKRHVLARQKPIEHEEDKNSPLGNRRSSTMSDSSYSGRWTVRCASIASHASSIDSRRVQVDLHSPEVVPKSILRSPKRYNSGPSTTPSVEKEFRSQLSVCSEPPAAIRQLSGQSSLEPCFPEETTEFYDDKLSTTSDVEIATTQMPQTPHTDDNTTKASILKKPRPDTLPLHAGAAILQFTKSFNESNKLLQRSSSSRTFYRPKPHIPKELDDSIFYIRSTGEREMINNNDLYDLINERRSTLLKTDSEAALNERKLSSFSLMQEIPEQKGTSVEIEEYEVVQLETRSESERLECKGEQNETTLQIEEADTNGTANAI